MTQDVCPLNRNDSAVAVVNLWREGHQRFFVPWKSVQRTKKQRKIWGEKCNWCVFFAIFLQFSCLREAKWERNISFCTETSCVWQGGGSRSPVQRSCPEILLIYYEKASKSPGPGQGYPDLTEKQRKNASRKREKSRILRDSFRFLQDPQNVTIFRFWGENGNKKQESCCRVISHKYR